MPGIQFFDSKEVEWKDITFYFSGAEVGKMREFKVKRAMEKTHLHAAGDEPISIQKGNRTYTTEFKILKGVLDNLNDAAIAAGGKDCLDIVIDVVIVYRKKGTRGRRRLLVTGVEFTEYEEGMAQGDKQMEITLPGLALNAIDLAA